MKRAILPGLVFLFCVCAACSDPPEGVVEFHGVDAIPNNREDVRAKFDEDGNILLDKTVLFVRCYCPDCLHKRGILRRIEPGVTECPDVEECGLEGIRWRSEYDCPYCGKTGKCIACENMQQVDGACYNCRGEGVVSFMGKAPPCPNCRDQRPPEDIETVCPKDKSCCPVCHGTMRCPVCGGAGKLDMEIIQERHEAIPPEELIK